MADIKIYGTLVNGTDSGKVANASQIFDDALNKFQSQINQEHSGVVKFKFAHWNIGHFTYYDGKSGSDTPDIPNADSDEMALRYRKALNEINADVLGICEDDPVFDAVGNTSISKLYYKYGIRYQGTKYNYMCASIYANLPITVISVEEVLFPQTYHPNRYYKVVTAMLNGKTVKFVETHLDWQGTTERQSQIQKLISDFSADDYVIIGGDFNMDDSAEYDSFANAGYTMANHDYVGDLETSENPSTHIRKPLDNVLAKGFVLSNITVNDGSFTLSDHAAISCDLEMIM